MPIHELNLINRREVARGTFEFNFDKPESLIFTPGQYAGFTLINPFETDSNGITRRFSILSTPNDKHISFATRMQNSAYKRVLNRFNPGDKIKFAGPTGSFTLHEDSQIPAVFIAGGIGIAPFYSMIKYVTEQQSSQLLYLFYGNRLLEDAAYLDELHALGKINPNLILIPTMAIPDSSWSGETGFITSTMIKKYIPNILQPIYYICGSPTMVTTLQETLVEMGIEDNQIKVEDFPGY